MPQENDSDFFEKRNKTVTAVAAATVTRGILDSELCCAPFRFLQGLFRQFV